MLRLHKYNLYTFNFFILYLPSHKLLFVKCLNEIQYKYKVEQIA